ncbi:MAG: V-type ATP synthase subunit A [Verrucomicrobiota bacterium]|nr:V-type ATP synthase subunit A [Verrucomicrobiota bacterium]
MSNNKTGQVIAVNGNMVTVAFDTHVIQNEVAYIKVGEARLKSEVIRVKGKNADLQVFESTNGVKVGQDVEFSDQLLSVELGPGILGNVYDGLQNPLNDLAEKSGYFLKRGEYLCALNEEVKWTFTPLAKNGDILEAGDTIGTVPENVCTHKIMLPFAFKGDWEVISVIEKGDYTVRENIAKVKQGRETRDVTMVQEWPVKVPISNYQERLLPVDPLVTRTRTIDTFFPVAKGGTFCTPGPFGAGKTVLQHALSQYADIDIVIVAACGERAGEVVEILREFPEIDDPKTGGKLIDRTIIVCNTSSMPVAAREASVYTGVTLAEYYRQMGLDCLLLADSTSRWAQALREVSGRLEEIPGEESFPAYLESLIAAFYERAALVRFKDGSTGSVTIGGAVSPAGGNFEEPVTQATLKVVGSFLGLSRERADARRFPSIHPIDSWSKYSSFIDINKVELARKVLRDGTEVSQMMKVVGEEGITTEDFTVFMKSEFLDAVYLQQSPFEKVEAATSEKRQKHIFDIICTILQYDFGFKEKDEVRKYFNHLRQLFIDLNYMVYESDEFVEQEKDIIEFLKKSDLEITI